MPSPVFTISQLVSAIQYTGSNSADLDAQVPNASIVSEVGGVLTLDLNGNNHVVATNEWVSWNVNGYTVLTHNQFLVEWSCVPLCAAVNSLVEDVAELSGDVSALESAGAVRAVGVAPVPTLLLGQDTTVAVTLQPAMPDSGYTALAATFGGVNLADLDVTSVSVVDTDTVNVAVDNVGLGTVSGVTVIVHAID